MTKSITGVTERDPNLAEQPASWISTASLKACLSARGLLTTTQHTLTIFGISSVALIGLLFARPDLVSHLAGNFSTEPEVSIVAAEPAPSGFVATAPVVPATKEVALLATKKQQQWVTSWLSKRYRVAGDAASMFVSTAYLTAHEIKLDPLLILAVMAIESGLNPFAESPVGAQGLMQVMSKIHHARFEDLGGVQAALNPAANIRVGSMILKDYVTRGGSIEAGLKTYVGAGAFDTDFGYGSRVLAEYRRLKQVSAGQKVSIHATKSAPQNQDLASL